MGQSLNGVILFVMSYLIDLPVNHPFQRKMDVISHNLGHLRYKLPNDVEKKFKNIDNLVLIYKIGRFANR